MSSPIDVNSCKKTADNMSQAAAEKNCSFDSSWYYRRVKLITRETGIVLSDVGVPLMTMGLMHGFGRTHSQDYLRLMKKYPSGSMVFLMGLALRAMGNYLEQGRRAALLR